MCGGFRWGQRAWREIKQDLCQSRWMSVSAMSSDSHRLSHLSVSLSPSFFQSAALWCTSVAMNSSPSPAPEQIRVLHQMWVQISLPFPSFLHSSAFCLPFSLSLLFNLCLSLSQSHVREQRKAVGRSCRPLANLIRRTVTEEVCETAVVTITLSVSDFLLKSSSLLILSRAPELYNHLNQQITRSIVTATGSASTRGTRALFCYCGWEWT